MQCARCRLAPRSRRFLGNSPGLANVAASSATRVPDASPLSRYHPCTMKLHQIKIEFNAEEDRLMLRVSTVSAEEALLWLTRRCVLRLWPLLVGGVEASPDVAQRVVDADAKKALLEFQHEKALSQAQFGKQYADTPRTRPLGDVPLLVTKLQRRAGPDGRLVIGLLPTQGEGIFLTLDEPLLHGFIKLLQKAVERAEWGFKLDLPWGEAGPPAGERTLQ